AENTETKQYLNEMPKTKDVIYTNFCDIAMKVTENRIVVLFYQSLLNRYESNKFFPESHRGLDQAISCSKLTFNIQCLLTE
ncbi:MAG: hypothetical protein AAB283_06915, partial [Planctomycetota bacterium]